MNFVLHFNVYLYYLICNELLMITLSIKLIVTCILFGVEHIQIGWANYTSIYYFAQILHTIRIDSINFIMSMEI